MNFEAVDVPEDGSDVFLDSTIFRRQLAVLDGMTNLAELKAAEDFWTTHNQSGKLFEGYCNGKSAVAVMPGVLPAGVHECLLVRTYASTSLPDLG